MLRGALRSGIGLTMTGRSEQDSQGSPIRAQEGLKAAHFSVGGWLKLALSIHPSKSPTKFHFMPIKMRKQHGELHAQ